MIATRYDFTAAVPAAADLGRVHFIAIGGAGMSGIARVMLARGIPVSGSDARDSDLLRSLADQGATVHVGHDPSYVQEAATVVVSSAIRDDNVELVAARERGLRVLHRSQALASLTVGKQVVAIAGANGKTTTSSMLTVALLSLGIDPFFAIGGEIAALGTNAHDGSGEVAVVEADESDGSFIVYRPQVAVVTNVQPDHLDFYGTFEEVKAAYLTFARSIRPGGLLVACADDAGSVELAQRAAADGIRVLTYGQSSEADVRVGQTTADGFSTRVTVTFPDGEFELRLPVPGVHNVLNATAALVAATAGLGQSADAVLAGLATFGGARRRFEILGVAGGATFVDDYAHNPGKVAAVVSTSRQLVASPGKLIVVFQPHLYSRTADFHVELGAGLASADEIVVMDVYAAREDPVPGVSGQLVADSVAATAGFAGRVRYAAGWDEARDLVASLVGPGDLVLTVGAGDVTALGPQVMRLVEPEAAPR